MFRFDPRYLYDTGKSANHHHDSQLNHKEKFNIRCTVEGTPDSKSDRNQDESSTKFPESEKPQQTYKRYQHMGGFVVVVVISTDTRWLVINVIMSFKDMNSF